MTSSLYYPCKLRFDILIILKTILQYGIVLQFDINWLAIGDEGKLGIVCFSYMYLAFLSFSCDNVIRHLHISHNAPYLTPLFIRGDSFRYRDISDWSFYGYTQMR